MFSNFIVISNDNFYSVFQIFNFDFLNITQLYLFSTVLHFYQVQLSRRKITVVVTAATLHLITVVWLRLFKYMCGSGHSLHHYSLIVLRVVRPVFVQPVFVPSFCLKIFIQSISSNPNRLGQVRFRLGQVRLGQIRLDQVSLGLDDNRLAENELDKKQVYHHKQYFHSNPTPWKNCIHYTTLASLGIMVASIKGLP